MASTFVVSRVGGQRFMVRYKRHFVAECLGTDPMQLALTLSNLNLNPKSATLQKELRAAIERFLFLESRSHEKFGKPKIFRIWRVDSKTLQIDFGGSSLELKSDAAGDAVLKRCLDDLGANDLLLSDLKRELAEFRKNDTPDPLADVLLFRHEGVLKVLVKESIHTPSGDNDAAILRLAKQLKTVDPDRLLATFHVFQRNEKRIKAAMASQS